MKIVRHPSFAVGRRRSLLQVAVGGVIAGAILYAVGATWPSAGLLKIVAFMPIAAALRALPGSLRCAIGSQQEDRLREELVALGEEYTLVINQPLPDRGGDVDLALFGPSGILVIESKFWTVPAECNGDAWYLLRDRGRRQRVKSPSMQLKENVKAMKTLHPECHVQGVLVFNKSVKLAIEGLSIPVIRSGELLAYVRSLGDKRQVDRGHEVAA